MFAGSYHEGLLHDNHKFRWMSHVIGSHVPWWNLWQNKVLSNEIFIDALTNCGACAILVSEENEVCTWLWSSCLLGAVRSHVKRSQDDLHDWDHQDFAGLPYCTWWLLLDIFRYQCIPMRLSDLLFLNQYPPLFLVHESTTHLCSMGWLSRKGSVVLPIRHQDPIFVPQARVWGLFPWQLWG